ncbi:DUF1353 domain-containing protein [Hyphomicrobium sp.]|uniref:DUF1353 domain-containing protein n=1 Tax=Hyphomicrobium sp. TaxID=82 RepID=UPI0025BE4268|nr:DUF1353 domain-containing protein [Hyphomicrobium sp.]MCC7252995.1 DUF1353 domain-containing protein [Hyphomicrobium sp.]
MKLTSSISRRTFSRGAATSLLTAAATGTLPRLATAVPKPGFSGSVVAEWLDDGRSMKIVRPIEYVSTDGRRWPVPAETVVDGASIPSPFWSIVGGPFEGLYRAPSVVHDYYCEVRTRPSDDVHRVFHEAMLTAGVGKQRAWLMFQAVARFGPRWPAPRIDPRCEVVDENFDFELCARNSSKPRSTIPKIDDAALLQFSKDLEGSADPADLETLRSQIGAAR